MAKFNSQIQNVKTYFKLLFTNHPIILNQKDIEESVKSWISNYFLQTVGYEPSIDKPITFNEKLQWYKLYYRDSLLTQCSDKYLVREYIEEKVGEEYLVKLFGVYNSTDSLDLNNFPNKFVLKVNHGSA